SHGRLFVFDAGYNLSLGRHLTTFSRSASSSSHPAESPVFPGGFLIASDGNSTYHSLQVRATSRQRRGLVFQVHYTLSKSIDTVSTDRPGVFRSLAPGPVYGDNSALNRGLSDFDRRHRAVGFFLWRGPQGVRVSRPLRALINGWEIAG